MFPWLVKYIVTPLLHPGVQGSPTGGPSGNQRDRSARSELIAPCSVVTSARSVSGVMCSLCLGGMVNGIRQHVGLVTFKGDCALDESLERHYDCFVLDWCSFFSPDTSLTSASISRIARFPNTRSITSWSSRSAMFFGSFRFFFFGV